MKRLIENNLKKEFVMLFILIILIIEFVYMLYLKNDVSKTIDENEDNRVLAANSLNNEINRPDYNLFEFISKEQFFRWQVGKINESIIFCENSKYFFDSIEKNEHQILILVDSCYKIKCDEYSKNQEYVYLNIHVKLKNLDNSSGMINIKPMCQLILDDGSYDEFNTDKFTLVDMSFDTDVEGYTLANVPADNGKINTDMGFVRTDDWSKHFFRVYIESNSEISYTCVFRTPKEYADDENLVIGNDDSHASRRWDGEKEVTYDNGGYRIYINRQ